jgi:hypothetical protein
MDWSYLVGINVFHDYREHQVVHIGTRCLDVLRQSVLCKGLMFALVKYLRDDFVIVFCEEILEKEARRSQHNFVQSIQILFTIMMNPHL